MNQNACKSPEIHSDWTILGDKSTPEPITVAKGWHVPIGQADVILPSMELVSLEPQFLKGMWELQGRGKGG